MFRAKALASALVAVTLGGAGLAQTTGYTFDPHPHFKRLVQLSPKTQGAMQAQAGVVPKGTTAASSSGVTIESVPHWFSSFLGTDGNIYPYVMVGTKPTHGGTSIIETPIQPLKVQFQGNPKDENGNVVVYDAQPVLNAFAKSPNFTKAAYNSGYTQYGDAGQRATFWKGMNRDWHVLLSKSVREEQTITVPTSAYLPFGYYDSNNKFHFLFYAVDYGYWTQAIQNLVVNDQFSHNEFPFILTNGVYLYENLGGGNYGCCVLGYHTAYDKSANAAGTEVLVQSYAWGSWIAPGIFGGGAEDVFGTSHEIAEWLNDPFPQPFMNYVRPWLFPGSTNACQGNLEVGDPIEVLSYGAFPVNGYHPTNIALFQWFANDGTNRVSNALDEAYSWPDSGDLTAPAQVCPGY